MINNMDIRKSLATIERAVSELEAKNASQKRELHQFKREKRMSDKLQETFVNTLVLDLSGKSPWKASVKPVSSIVVGANECLVCKKKMQTKTVLVGDENYTFDAKTLFYCKECKKYYASEALKEKCCVQDCDNTAFVQGYCFDCWKEVVNQSIDN